MANREKISKKFNTMKNLKYILSLITLLFFCVGIWGQIDGRIDNWRYWKEKAEQNIIPFNPNVPPAPANFKGTMINAKSYNFDSPDILLISGSSVTQSENSVFVNPIDNQISLVSNNSTLGGNVRGTNALFSFDGGNSWTGSISGAGGINKGDPAVAINLSGKYFVGHITSAGGQGIAISSNNGTSWSTTTISNPSGVLLDKNHMWVDNSNSSTYKNNLYSAWTSFGGVNDKEIEISKSSNNGNSWSSPVSISNNINAGSHNQGVNIQTGPNGEVYAVWAVYDSWPAKEKALGFSRSLNGGNSFSSATRIINNIKGIRWDPRNFSSSQNRHGKNMRTNSYPSMAVDISGGPNNGTIYVVWSNIGTPGVNTGTDVSVYLIKSTNKGVSWSTPRRINQDNLGNKQYFPWITCDPTTGNLSVIFYDDRNVGGAKVEAWVANSTDGGNNWDEFRVSDVAFTPSPIPGLSGGYMGDYLGISSRDGRVYPVWTDNRSGQTLSYTSPFVLGGCEDSLTINTDVVSGQTDNKQAENTIIAQNIINSGALANYSAGQQVILKNDFSAKTGSTFKAFIEDCSLNSNSQKSAQYVKAPKSRVNTYFKEGKTDVSFKVFPNPTNGIFNINLPENISNFKIEIYSLSRGLVHSSNYNKKNVANFQANLANFPNGIYIVKITDKDKIYTSKIIKQ